MSTGSPTSPRKTAAADLTAVETALQLLARAVRQFHTYPAASPLCVDAVMACYDALRAIAHRDRVSLRVGPHDLIIDDTQIGAGTVIEHEITSRLFKLRVAAIEIQCAAAPRELSRFCVDLVSSDDSRESEDTFAERLAEHGVTAIVPEMARRPAVMDVGAPGAHTTDLLSLERRRQQGIAQLEVAGSYLYPPDRGWVRTDPSQGLSQVSLLDLVVLVDDPAEIATMLVQLTDDDLSGPGVQQAALERKYTEVTRLFSALDPRLAQAMFGKLAKAVLNLEPDRRNHLLQRTILPGLLDGDATGVVLRDFPDVDLAESICLLLDLETAAPEMLSAVLNRLDLTTDRRTTLVPLIEQRMEAIHGGRNGNDDSFESSGAERYARELIRIDHGRETDFSEFAAFDLSMDADAEKAVSNVHAAIAATDAPMAQLQVVAHLVRIERNPDLVLAFLVRAQHLLAGLERTGRWPDVIAALKGYRCLGEELRSRRPDVADVIAKAMSDYCTPTRLLTLVEMHERDEEGRATASSMLRAFGPALVPGLVELMNRPLDTGVGALVPLMCDMAPAIAPALIAEIESCNPAAARVIVRILGHAGAGHEIVLGRLAEHSEGQIAREAMRALARIGTATAAALVGRQIREGRDDRHGGAEDALWQFPPAQTAMQVRELLRAREFVLSHPKTAARLIGRAGQSRVQGLEETLSSLEGLRFRFWKPRLVQVALKAREHRTR